MSTPLHAAISFAITLTFTHNPIILGLAVLLGIMPDIGRLFQKDPSDWDKFYRWAHTTKWLYWVPFWNIHIFIDKYTHKPEGGWTDAAIYWEVILWVISIFVIYLFY